MLSWQYVSIKFLIINEKIVIIVSAHAATKLPLPLPLHESSDLNFVIDNISHNSLNFS